MKKLQVLGTGCPKCKKLYELVMQVVKDTGAQAEVFKVDDINEILAFGVMMTPALAVDGVVKIAGRVPRIDEIRNIIQ